MARMKFKREVPPRGWSYIQPVTRLKILGESLPDLADKVYRHRLYKGLERASVAEAGLDIERQICTRLGTRECSPEGTADEWVPVTENPTIEMSAVIGFSKAALEWISSGRELVPESEANRRAEICKACPLNNPMTGCKCSIFYKMVNMAVPEARRDPELGVCGACACALQAKVNLPMNVVNESNAGRNLSFPVFCWQSPSNQNDIASVGSGA